MLCAMTSRKPVQAHLEHMSEASCESFSPPLAIAGCTSVGLQVFGPAFKRNSRWSLTQPVPDVGDEETPYNVVDKFYDFWFSFKSWREFPHDDEEDIEQAESREEKR